MKLLKEQVLLEEKDISIEYETPKVTLYSVHSYDQVMSFVEHNYFGGLSQNTIEDCIKDGPAFVLLDKQTNVHYFIHGKTCLCKGETGHNVSLYLLTDPDDKLFNMLIKTFNIASYTTISTLYNAIRGHIFEDTYDPFVVDIIKGDPFTAFISFDNYNIPIKDTYITAFLDTTYYGQPVNTQMQSLRILCKIFGNDFFTNRHSAILNDYIKGIINDFKTDPDTHNLMSVYDVVGDLLLTKDFEYVLKLCLFYYDWSEVDIADLYDVFKNQLLDGPYTFVFDNYMKLTNGDLSEIRHHIGNAIIGSVHEHYITEYIMDVTSWPYEVDFGTSEIADNLSSRDNSKDFIEGCLTNDIAEYWYGNYYEARLDEISWDDIDIHNQELLESHGITEGNLGSIEDFDLTRAFSVAMSEGNDVGAQNACLKDFNDAFYDAVPGNCSVYLPYTDNNSSGEVRVAISLDFVESNLEDIWDNFNYYSSDITECILRTFLDQLSDNFRFYDHDWYDFDVDAYNWRLADELHEVDWDSVEIPNDDLEEAWLNQDGGIWDYETSDIDGEDVVDITKHEMSYYCNFLNPKDLEYMQKAKGVTGEIVQMSPNEYFDECSKIFNMPKDKLIAGVKDDPSIDTLRKVITQYKKKLCIPMLNKATNQQEGRHRMYVLGDMFGWDKKFPVLVVTNY